ncbi:MAG: serine/threonine-protein kinase [Polyangiales bacterium]
MSDDDAWAEELIGSTLVDRYRVDEVIGRGGMGVVLAATHLKLQRPVAIKMMHPMLSRDSTIMQRFHQEARAAASVGSDGVVEVSDFDDDPEHGPFLVMELLRGESLVDVLKDGRVEPPRAIWIVGQLLDVLQAVHAKGIIHRDLKPPNVFLHQDEAGGEVVKVVDFGIAKVHARHLTMTGQIVGTPRFMAPEQARGDDVDHRIDLYGAGLLLYCALTGLPPYATVPARKVIERISQGPPSLRTLRPDLPGALLDVVDRALEPDPENRFQSAEAMADALRAVDLEGPPPRDTIRSDAPPVFAPKKAEPTSEAGGLDAANLAASSPGELHEPSEAIVVPQRHGWKYLVVLAVLGGLGAGAFFYIKSQESLSIRAALESEGSCGVPQGDVSILPTTTGFLFEERDADNPERLHIEERGDLYHVSVGASTEGYGDEVRPGTGPRHIEVRALSSESVDLRLHRITLVGPEGPCVITGEIRSTP